MNYMHFCKHIKHASSITFQTLISVKFYFNKSTQHILYPTNGTLEQAPPNSQTYMHIVV
jgi:hypothetical protein